MIDNKVVSEKMMQEMNCASGVNTVLEVLECSDGRKIILEKVWDRYQIRTGVNWGVGVRNSGSKSYIKKIWNDVKNGVDKWRILR